MTCGPWTVKLGHMKNTLAILLGLAMACPAVLNAEPAPWYQWRSKSTGDMACSQTPLGAGWEKFSGPYRDARCEIRKTGK
ncbi:hypothetical protein SRABI118_03726 [Massilia sp. Bi118]|nr:hypothetical protein SRABI118_03726 [Massilia sp. Bi118]